MAKWYSKEEALSKLQHYCAYQDRSHQEVRQKLMEWRVDAEWREEIIVELITENFLNEERYARSYARGKFRIKRWGRNKILQGLKQQRISAYCIKKAMEEIEPDAYIQTIDTLIKKKHAQVKGGDQYQLKQKLARYLIQRGYESPIVWERIHHLLSD